MALKELGCFPWHYEMYVGYRHKQICVNNVNNVNGKFILSECGKFFNRPYTWILLVEGEALLT
jgi:hypothetical protein